MPDVSPRRKSWVSWLLIVSLGLNIAVVGLAIGLVIKGPPDHARPDHSDWLNLRVLPEPYRSDLGREMRRGRKDWNEKRDNLKRQRESLAKALTAEPYQQDTVREILNEERHVLEEITRGGMELLLVQIGRMSPQERADYAKALLSARSQERTERRKH